MSNQKNISKAIPTTETRGADGALDKAFKCAQIFALVAIPIGIAWQSNRVQESLAKTSLSKDFIQIAMPILREPRNEKVQDEALRQWAGEVIAKYSPVPISSKAASQFSGAAMAMTATNPFLVRAMDKRPACPAVASTGLTPEQQEAIKNLHSACSQNQTDLFWLQTHMRMINPYAVDTAESVTRR